MSMLEAECTRCHQVFVPHSATPADLVHGETDEGLECGGIGVIQGAWGLEGPKAEVGLKFDSVVATERHGMDFPNCDDPDCEFHHPEVREF